MTFANNIDQQKLAEATLAILSLTAHGDPDTPRAWKGISWDILDILYNNGWIFDPVGKQKSIMFTREGNELAKEFMQKHFKNQ